MMRVVVTGAAGFVGRHLVTHLARHGHEVVALVHDPASTLALDEQLGASVTTVAGFLHDERFVAEQLDGAHCVIHLAAKREGQSEGELVSVNAQLTGLLARAASQVATMERFVYLSCLPAADPEPPEVPKKPGKKDPKRQPSVRRRSTRLSRYARSKRLGEERVLALAEDLPVTVLRAPLIYGPGDKNNLNLFKRMKRKLVPLPAKGRDALSVLFVDDLCEALLAAISREHPSGSVFEVSASNTLTWAEFTEAVSHALGVSSRPVGVPYWIFSLANRANPRKKPQPVQMLQTGREWRQRDWTCDSHAIESALGWRPTTPPLEGIARTTRWYRDAGWL